jgi:RsiW-degrading membrane proteinase PrsW (M82 family)
MDFKKHPFYKFALYVIVPFLVIFASANILFRNGPGPGSGLPLSEEYYRQALRTNLTSIESHRNYIDAHFRIPYYISRHHYRDDNTIRGEYESYSKNADPAVSDMGHYGLGYYYIKLNNTVMALSNYLKVANTNLAYLNNSIGYIYSFNRDYDRAISFFSNEIRLKGYLSGAYLNLSQALYLKKDFKPLKILITDDSVKQYIPVRLFRMSALAGNDYLLYFRLYMSDIFSGIRPEGLAASLAILLLWFFYIRRLDIFEPEKYKYMVITLALGMAFALMCMMMYDFWDFKLGLRMTGVWYEDLFYCFFGIGVIEEISKILPFLLILFCTKAVSRSVDYVIYASVSALGFAFVENLQYLNAAGTGSIFARCLTSTVIHMALTSIAVYGVLYVKYRLRKSNFLIITAAFLCAVIIHGIYDFFLISPSLYFITVASFVILIFVFMAYHVIISNAINASDSFDINSEGKLKVLHTYLIYGLSYIFILQFLALSAVYGAAEGNSTLLQGLVTYFYFMFALSYQLGSFKPGKGKWIKMSEYIGSRYSRNRSKE